MVHPNCPGWDMFCAEVQGVYQKHRGLANARRLPRLHPPRGAD